MSPQTIFEYALSFGREFYHLKNFLILYFETGFYYWFHLVALV